MSVSALVLSCVYIIAYFNALVNSFFKTFSKIFLFFLRQYHRNTHILYSTCYNYTICIIAVIYLYYRYYLYKPIRTAYIFTAIYSLYFIILISIISILSVLIVISKINYRAYGNTPRPPLYIVVFCTAYTIYCGILFSQTFV